MSAESPAPLPEKRPINPWTLWIPLIMIALGVVVLYNYLIFNSIQKKEDKITLADGTAIHRPPFMGRLETDMEFTERSGKKVHLYHRLLGLHPLPARLRRSDRQTEKTPR